jgi:hypothetical protein
MITGSCLCGQLSYELDETSAVGGMHCHCTDCRKATGSGKASIINFPKSAVKLSGSYKTYETIGTGGLHIQRGFCPDCGSQLMTLVGEMPDNIFIKAGTMDDSSWAQFDISIWGDSAQDWSPADQRLPVLPKNMTT